MAIAQQRGFTLQEVLIALVLVAVLAAFALPKLLLAAADYHRKTVLKETISLLNGIVYEGSLSGKLHPYNYTDFILRQVNAVQVCRTDVRTEHCWDHPSFTYFGLQEPGFNLSNGAHVRGFVRGCCTVSGAHAVMFIVDWNGPQGPNIDGDDQILLLANYGKIAWGDYKPGTVDAYKEASAPSEALYNQIFQ